MPCLYNLPEQERFCQFCSAACDERPAVKVITTTTTAVPFIEENQMPMDTKDQLIDEVHKLAFPEPRNPRGLQIQRVPRGQTTGRT